MPGEDLIEHARALAPLLAEHAAEAERLRQPHAAVMAALEDSGIFELMVPSRYGGRGLDLDTYLEVGLALAEGDASMAWVASFYIEHNWWFCQFPEPFQKELFANRTYVLAPGTLAPSSLAEPCAGGFRLSGRLKFATGVVHGDWVICGARVERDEAAPDLLFLALPKADVEVEDTWQTDGMCGTGSHDVVIQDQFVPEERSVSSTEMMEGKAPGSRLHDGPLYRTPLVPILALAAAMPAVGQARVAVREFRERLAERMLMASASVQAEKPAAQMRLARADIQAQQAEALLRRMVGEMMALRDRATPIGWRRRPWRWTRASASCRASPRRVARARTSSRVGCSGRSATSTCSRAT